MRVLFVCTSPFLDGGIGLSVGRLALALEEVGHQCEVVIPASVATAAIGVPVRPDDRLTCSTERLPRAGEVAAALAVGRPDLVVVSDGRADLLEQAMSVAPTLLHSHMHWPSCPDSVRYWNRARTECRVHAGWKCLALRPMLGCSGRSQVRSPEPVLAFERRRRLLRGGEVGLLSISSDQARLAIEHGVPSRASAVLPNLGMRMGVADLEALDDPGEGDRATVSFVGRLSKEKGAGLLPALGGSLPLGTALAVFGTGYLEAGLRGSLGIALRGQVSQARIARALRWTKGVVFPSLWPEPGGIVGIDAQLFGAPLAAFDVGAARDWPRVDSFEPGDVEGLASWAAARSELTSPRPAARIAEVQARYWSAVGRRADVLFRAFVDGGRFPPIELDAVTQDLLAAGV